MLEQIYLKMVFYSVLTKLHLLIFIGNIDPTIDKGKNVVATVNKLIEAYMTG